MNPPSDTVQRISRLTPLGDVLARLETIVVPVPPRDSDPAAAVGSTLAADIVATADWPAAPTAIRDGWAVAADLLTDAGAYAPTPLSPPPLWVEVGAPMPAGTDAVLPLDAVTLTRTGAEAHLSVATGDGVLQTGADVRKGTVIRRAGERLRPGDAALLRMTKIAGVSMRAPRVTIFSVRVPTRSAADTISPVLARAIETEGGIAQVAQASSLESALLDRQSDAIVTIGGTGSGRQDASVKTLARVGKVEVHGVGIAPGETMAFGSANGKPVLMLPGRLDATLSAFLILGRALLAKLSGRTESEPTAIGKLKKKVTSTIGLADVVLVRRDGEDVEPLASGFFAWSALARADGWILVPPDSEGFAARAPVEVRPLP
jgi:molybdopterin molybdotransferase